jgi:hypothetical protein
MFKRIKNLLDISRYSVEELKTTPPQQATEAPDMPNEMATIVEMKETNPLNYIEDATTEQSLDDSAAGN